MTSPLSSVTRAGRRKSASRTESAGITGITDGAGQSSEAAGPPSRWIVPAVLAVPFVVTVAALRGLTATLPIFHGSDELVYQYPTILRFANELPFPNLHSYGAAQTPLFHLVMAYAGKAVGFELWRLRLLEAVISYLLALAVFRLLRRRIGIEWRTALALTVLFAISPYVFGYSFRLMTDNLALLFTVMAIERFERFRQAAQLRAFALGCACAGAAVLTRQSTAFLFGVAALYLLVAIRRLTPAGSAAAASAIALAALPAGLLFLNWHGLVPPGGDPSSCGLCSARAGARGLEVPTTELTLATVGLYGAVLFAPAALIAVRDWIAGHPDGGVRHGAGSPLSPALAGALAAAAAGCLLLALAPASPGAHAAGVLWKAAGKLPTLSESSLLFWLLVPLAGPVLWLRIRRAPHSWALAAFAACFLASTLVIRFPWQKYVDPLALLLLLMTVRRRELASPRMLLGAAVLAVAFATYAAAYSEHIDARVADRGPQAAAHL